MANIRQVEAPKGLGLNPTETGIESMAAVGRRLGAFGSQIAEDYNQEGKAVAGAIGAVGQVAENYMTHRDISIGAAAGAQFIAKKNDEWNETAKNADPNDPTTQKKFLAEKLEPELEQFKDGFSTERSKQWAEHFVDQYRQHMFEKTSSDMSTLAGIAVRKNVATTVNGLSSAVASDPSSLDFALASVDHSIGATVASSPNIKATDAASITQEVGLKAKESIVKAAVSGMIQKNPNIDLDAIQKKYGEYINGAEMKMFAKAAQTQAKVDFLQQKQLESYQRQQQERKANDEMSKVITDNVTIDPQTNRPVINPKALQQTLDVAKKYPEAGSALARTTLDWIEHQQNQKDVPTRSDPTVKMDLTDRMFDPNKPTTTRDLMRAQIAGKLSDHDFTVMHRLVTELEQTPLKGPLWETTAAAVKDTLILNVPGIPGKDHVGTSNYATFMQTFLPDYIAKSRAGTLPPNALDVKDPTSMISQAMAPFKRTAAQRMSDYTAGMGGLGGAPATPNPSTRKIGDVPVPAALNGIASLQYNKGTGQFRDQTTGKVYDAKGNEVKP